MHIWTFLTMDPTHSDPPTMEHFVTQPDPTRLDPTQSQRDLCPTLILRHIRRVSKLEQLEGTHRVRTHAISLYPNLTLTLTFGFQPQNPVTSRISQGHSLYQF